MVVSAQVALRTFLWRACASCSTGKTRLVEQAAMMAARRAACAAGSKVSMQREMEDGGSAATDMQNYAQGLLGNECYQHIRPAL